MGLDELIAAKWTYGRVEEHDGEYVETEFRDWLRIPLVPVRSFWIVDDRGSQRSGFPIKLHARSVAATYLRIWAPGIATAVLVLWSSPLATVIAATLFGLSAWSWTWWPRDAALRRRSDFDLAAFGSRCDPTRMTGEMHRRLADELVVRAGARGDPRSPDDVVRFGARTVDEALHAYGCLRLADAQSAVQCDYVQNSDRGSLRRVTLCLVGRHILAVAGGNRVHDQERWLQGYIEALPGADVASWAGPLRKQISADSRYYGFYLRRVSYGDDTPDDDLPYYDFYLRRVSSGDDTPDDAESQAGLGVRPDRGEQHAGGNRTYEALIHALTVAAILAIVAGWFVWIRLWQHRRRVATWILPG